MKFVGTKRVKIESLKLPGDWKKILRSEDAKAIGESLAHVPILQRPGVRKKDRAVLWGRHRLAALHEHDGQRVVEVDLWDCTDEEAELAKDVENAFRRGPDMAARLRLVERWTKEIAAMRDEKEGQSPNNVTSETLPRGRRKEPVTEAREKAAAMAGVKPEAIKKQEQRKQAKEREAWGADEPEAESWLYRLGTFECWGLEHLITEDFARTVVQTREAAKEVAAKLTGTLASITELTKSDPDVMVRLGGQEVYRQVQELAHGLRSIVPVALCPWCKGLPKLLKTCQGCRGLMTVGQHALDNVPPELKQSGPEAGVWTGPNQFCRLSEVA